MNTTITNYAFGLLGWSFLGRNGNQNTRVGPEDGCDANGVPYAHHTWIGYFQEGNFGEALKWNEKACEIRVGDPRSGPTYIIAEKGCRALILASLEKYDEAIRDISQTLDECEKEFPASIKGDEIILETMDTASMVHRMVGRYVLADVLSEQVWRGYEGHKRIGPTDPRTLSAMLRRAQFLRERGKHRHAKELYEKAYEYVLQKWEKPSSPPELDDILIVYHRARHLESLENDPDKSKALELYAKAKEACDKVLEKDDKKNFDVRGIWRSI